MTTESPEVRAAAERRAGWRESCNYPDYPARSPYGDDGGSGRERIQDAMNLADAYLAIRAELARLRDERGDDDTPVDEAWLRSVLPKNASYVGYGQMKMSFRIEYTQLPEGWFHTTTGLPVRTRGDARRLCETFGITLDAAGGGGNASRV